MGASTRSLFFLIIPNTPKGVVMSTALRGRFVAKLIGLADHVSRRFPDCLLALEMHGLWLTAVALLGDSFMTTHSDWLIGKARLYHGLCRKCGEGELNVDAEFCDACAKQLDDELAEIEAENREKIDDPEEGD